MDLEYIWIAAMFGCTGKKKEKKIIFLYMRLDVRKKSKETNYFPFWVFKELRKIFLFSFFTFFPLN